MSSTAVQLSQFRAADQAQQSLEFAAIVGGGVELEGKSASIKSSSECIQLSNALSLFGLRSTSSTAARFRSRAATASPAFGYVLCAERAICISTTGSRRQLSIRNNERQGDSDEPDAPLLLERELAVGEGDVVIGREKRNQANNAADNGFEKGFAVKPQPPPGQQHIQIRRVSIHPKQPSPVQITATLVHAHCLTS